MKLENKRFLGFVFFLLLFGCAKEKTEPSSPKPSVETTFSSSIEKRACSAFSIALEQALDVHLFLPKDWSQILTKTFSCALQRTNAKISFASNASIEQLIQEVAEPIDSCEPYVKVVSKFQTSFQEASQKESKKIYQSNGQPLEEDSPIVHPLVLLLREALGCVLMNLDAYSNYSGIEEISVGPYAHFGAGIRILSPVGYDQNRKPNYLVVKGVYRGKPILPLDSRIYSINGKPVKEMTYKEAYIALNMVKWTEFANPENLSPLSLTFQKKDSTTEEKITLPRQQYAPSLSSFDWIQPSIGYAKLETFLSSSSYNPVVEVTQLLQSASSSELKVLILDLRGNLGGLVDNAEKLLDLFFPDGTTLFQEAWIKRSNSPEKQWVGPMEVKTQVVEPQLFHQKLPAILVLVDRRTASAAELVAQTLKDYDRAFILGEPTFGKFVGQTNKPVGFPLLGSMHITTLQLFTSQGKTIELQGVTPHFQVQDPVLDFLNQPKKALKEVAEKIQNHSLQHSNFSVLPLFYQAKDLKNWLPWSDAVPQFSVPNKQSQLDPTLVQGQFIASLIGKTKDSSLSHPRACYFSNPYAEDFKEDYDCILAWALQFANEWLKSEE